MWRGETLKAMVQVNSHAKGRAFQSRLVMLAIECEPHSTKLVSGLGVLGLEEVEKTSTVF